MLNGKVTEYINCSSKTFVMSKPSLGLGQG